MFPVSFRHTILSCHSFLKPRSKSSRLFRLHEPLTSPRARRTMATAMAKRLEGKTVVVTGASSGIGKSTGLSAASASDYNHADEVQQWNSLGPHPKVLGSS